MTTQQLGICDAVARHFSITKAKVRAQVELDIAENGHSPMISINTPQGELYIGASKNTIAVGKMMFFKILEKTELYSDLENLFTNYDAEVAAFYSGGALLSAYRAEEYIGLGGILVKKDNKQYGYVFEPISHYLQRYYPICQPD
jgi:hypothetical protein